MEKTIEKNKSQIYNSLYKNGYSNFKLDILEYCEDKHLVVKREQHYIDKIKPEYNILKFAGSRLGLIHSQFSKDLMKKNHTGKGKSISPDIISQRIITRSNGELTIVLNNNNGQSSSFISTRKAAEFIGVHHSYLAKSIKNNKFYLGRGFLVYKSFTCLDDIYSSEAYKVAKNKQR